MRGVWTQGICIKGDDDWFRKSTTWESFENQDADPNAAGRKRADSRHICATIGPCAGVVHEIILLAISLKGNWKMPNDAGVLDVLERWTSDISNVMKEESRYAKSITHSSESGRERELIISNVLDRVLPKTCSVGTGILVCASGKVSKQMDIVISRNDAPVLRHKASNLYFAETVLATIEVKTMLSKTEFSNALDNCRSLPSPLYYNDFPDSAEIKEHKDVYGAGSFYDSILPQTFIVAFEGNKSPDAYIETLQEKISVDKNYTLPYFICTDRFVGFRWDNGVFSGNKSDRTHEFYIAEVDNPIHFLIVALLEVVINKLPLQCDRYGVSPTLFPYLDIFKVNFRSCVGVVPFRHK